MRAVQYDTATYFAHHARADCAYNKRRAAVDAEAEHPPRLAFAYAALLQKLADRNPAGGVPADKADENSGRAAARQAKQQTGWFFKETPYRIAKPRFDGKAGKHKEREQRGYYY